MRDLIFVAVILAFFGVATLLVRACDRVIGPDPDTASPGGDDDLELPGAEDGVGDDEDAAAIAR